MTSAATDPFDQLCDYARESALLDSISSVLSWDERTKMPPAAGAYRAEQLTWISGQMHRRWTDPRLGDLLSELAEDARAADPASDVGATVRMLRWERDKRIKLPQRLVEEQARTASLGEQQWVDSRARNDFASFRPLLEKTVRLKIEEAECLGYAECRYDALLDHFEPGELTSNVARVLEGLRADLVPLVQAIVEGGRQADTSILQRVYPVELQQAFSRTAAERIGFDFSAGRLDETAHPFCSDMGPGDCRLTTRYLERLFNSAFFGTLHEAGHGLYDQGLRSQWYGLPPGQAISLGIHESQSRMWENLVGRSRAFWEWLFPEAQTTFTTALADVSLEDFYAAINDVRPSLIRVEADEATYNLHILIRFELEQALLNEELSVADLPAAWNEKYRQYLGIVPPSDRDGVLQDIHWSGGSIGYFPTYSLGNLYASQLFEQADRDLGGLNAQFAEGQFESLLAWLNEKVHRPGQCYSAAELVQRITGKPLSHQPLMRHLRGKFGPLYGLG